MSLLEMLQQPAVDRTATVKYKGAQYTLRGRASATLYERCFMLSDSDKTKYAQHWGRLNDTEFSESLVPKVMAIAETLEHEDDAEKRYDPTEIAKLAIIRGDLFLKLLVAALEVLGLTEDDVDAVSE